MQEADDASSVSSLSPSEQSSSTSLGPTARGQSSPLCCQWLALALVGSPSLMVVLVAVVLAVAFASLEQLLVTLLVIHLSMLALRLS